jgi:CheY-like chemotaxis protein
MTETHAMDRGLEPFPLARDSRERFIVNTLPKELTVLLIEDDDVDVMNIRRAFKKSNVTNPLFVAADGVEGLELLRAAVIDRARCLVLLDIGLPRMNGIEFIRELRSDPALRAIPVVVLTGSTDERDKVDAYGLNVAGYLVKPVSFIGFMELMAVLKRYWTVVEPP